jgi:DDE superfamily endonuclease.
MKAFNKATRAKADGRRRLLLVDGHNSHYTRGFLEHARNNQIQILCYPSHSTHVYQGLDVVIFGVLKRRWGEERDTYERKHGLKVDKTNFLSVYAAAHTRALTVDNIQAAFRKTGVVPFNPNVVTTDMMVPSLETSCHGSLPIRQPSPVRVLADAIHDELERRAVAEVQANTPQIDPTLLALDAIASTSASPLISSSPIRSSYQPPVFNSTTMSPIKQDRNKDLLKMAPHTEQERILQDALQDAEN